MISAKTRSVIWDPDPKSPRFLVCGSGDVRLYEVLPGEPAQFRTISACSELGQIRSVAWRRSRSTGEAPLVAVGLNTGRALLLRLSEFESNDSTASAQQINIRHTRPCNVVTYGGDRLAVGLEKGRGESLLVFDSSAQCTTQLCSSESVMAAGFLGPDLLATALSHKHLRLYDLRDTTSSVALGTSVTARAVSSIQPDPFSAWQFATTAEDATVRLWDVRRPDVPLFEFSEANSGSRYTADRASDSLSRDVLDSPQPFPPLSSAPHHPALQSPMIPQGPPAGSGTSALPMPSVPTHAVNGGSFLGYAPLNSYYQTSGSSLSPSSLVPAPHEPRTAAAPVVQALYSPHRRGLLSVLDRDGVFVREYCFASDAPVLLADRRSSLFLNSVSSFAYMPTGALLGVSRDASTSTSGHRLDTASFHAYERVAQAQTETALASAAKVTLFSTESDAVSARLNSGYGPSAKINAQVGPHEEFWRWMRRSDALARRCGVVHGYDFRFRGVFDLLEGFIADATDVDGRNDRADARGVPERAPMERIASDRTERATPRDGHPRDRSVRRGDSRARGGAHLPPAYLAAAAAAAEARGISVKPRLVPRRLALATCGKEWETSCARLESQGAFERAARHAFLTGDLVRASENLKRCGDDKLRMLGALLLLDSDTTRDLVKTLDAEGNAPWVRALVVYILGRDWAAVAAEPRLTLCERVAIALQFLDDGALGACLAQLAREHAATPTLDAVVLFGLRGAPALSLLQRFLDATNDIQTVALAAAFVYPGIASDPHEKAMAQRWIYTYRKLLDAQQLYIPRVAFDMAHGRRHAGLVHTPPQLVVRCHFCNATVSAQAHSRAHATESSACPNCAKQLPACCVCLTRTRIGSQDASLAWCQKCRHGGHLVHLLQWFEKNTICPVADCSCTCNNMYNS